MARKYKPIADSVLIEKMDMPDHTEGGILLPHVAQGDILKGKVVAVGPGMPDIPMFVKPGDVILYFSKNPITLDDYVLINQHNVYVVVEEEKYEIGVDPAIDNTSQTAIVYADENGKVKDCFNQEKNKC